MAFIVNFFKGVVDSVFDLFASFGWAGKNAKILLLGLDNAGKTTMLGMLKTGHMKAHLPTGQPQNDEVKVEGIRMKCFDMGGHKAARALWKQYFASTNGIVYMIDATDIERIEESGRELAQLLADDKLAKVPFLVLGNKIDIPGALSEAQLRNMLQLVTTGKDVKAAENVRPVELYMCSIEKRCGYQDGFKWLGQYI